MRARPADASGFVERGGVRVHYEVFGAGAPTILLLPTWSILHARQWKGQIPFLSRHFRVVAFDGRGNGRSDRPADPEAYRETEFAADALAVLDATGTPDAVLVSFSMGSIRALHLAAEHPERVRAAAFIAPSAPLAPPHPVRTVHPFEEPLDADEGWALFNAHAWRRDYRRFLEFFFSRVFNEPHSTKQIEDCVGWGLQTSPETLAATIRGAMATDPAHVRALCARVRCPVLVIHGDCDEVSPLARGEALARETGGRLVALSGCGHAPHARDPVRINLLLRRFAEERPAFPAVWTRARVRPRRALFVSSPIGLGHARRDVAIARELRRLVPGLEIEWLAQDPVTRVLEGEGERIHPASAALASESAHMAGEAAGHELNVFGAWRRMDEILLANFMVFHDVVRDGGYDLWIGDEAWEVDHYLHENPELKRAAYVWLSDFVGWLPMPEGGEREAFLTADYNAEMIAQIERFPRVRDRAIFIGDPEDVVPARFGPGLPWIRPWTEAHFSFSGYVRGFDAGALPDRAALRAERGWGPEERVCVVSVGGSGVGDALLSRVVEAHRVARRRVPALRTVVVAGPRIDPAVLPREEGVEVHGYVHDLYRTLAASDLAVVQGGLTTAMELTATNRPFLYVPLARHCEQNLHVHHRLRRHGAGRRIDFASAGPDALADAIAEAIGRDVRYLPVEEHGAARAARMIAEVL